MDYSLNARQEIKKEEINFQSVLDEITQKLKYINAEESSVDIRVKINSTAPFRSDKSRISIMLNNLISNSIRYSRPEVNDPFVEIGVDVTDKEANIIVRTMVLVLVKNTMIKYLKCFTGYHINL